MFRVFGVAIGWGLVCILAIPALAATYSVLPDGSGDYATIQQAISAAEDGDVIELGDGTFTGEGNRDFFIYGKEITLRSQSGDAESCIIDAFDAVEDHDIFGFQGTPEACHIENIQFTGGVSAQYGGAVFMDLGASPQFEGCIFRDNFAQRGGAVFVGRDCEPTFTDCEFTGNSAEDFAGGVMCAYETSHATFDHCLFIRNSAGGHGGGFAAWNECSPTLTNCTFYENSSAEGSGIGLRWGAAPTISRTIIAYGRLGAAFYGDGSATITISCCNLFANHGGDWAGPVVGLEGSDGNISLNPLFCDRGVDDLSLASDSPSAAFTAPNGACDYQGAVSAFCPSVFVCCVAGECQLVSYTECQSLGGDIVSDPAIERSCEPNPCPVPIEEVSWGTIKAQYRSLAD